MPNPSPVLEFAAVTMVWRPTRTVEAKWFLSLCNGAMHMHPMFEPCAVYVFHMGYSCDTLISETTCSVLLWSMSFMSVCLDHHRGIMLI